MVCLWLYVAPYGTLSWWVHKCLLESWINSHSRDQIWLNADFGPFFLIRNHEANAYQNLIWKISREDPKMRGHIKELFFTNFERNPLGSFCNKIRRPHIPSSNFVTGANLSKAINWRFYWVLQIRNQVVTSNNPSVYFDTTQTIFHSKKSVERKKVKFIKKLLFRILSPVSLFSVICFQQAL